VFISELVEIGLNMVIEEVWKMAVLRIVLTIILILVSIVFTVIVLMQEGKSAGLGAISGAAETYWGKNKGRSMEGNLVKATKILGIAFMLLAIILNLNF
jgi:preprotein translocase subunit SecG